MPSLLCPLCRAAIERGPKTWRCASGHAFDVAREGYVNLLAVQHKHSRDPGDSVAMVQARRAFLDAGHYDALRDAVVATLAPLRARSVLDIGCGEGTYTAALATIAADVTGLDIAKAAVQRAAKRFPAITWLVGSGALLPLADATIDVVTSLFTQLHAAEIARVLAPGGHLLVVTPAPEHLPAIRVALFDEVRAHVPEKFLDVLGSRFELAARREVRIELDLAQPALTQLLAMTPYAWKAKPERRAALEARTALADVAALSLLLLRKT